MVQAGDHIELLGTTDEYTKLEPGDQGNVTGVRTLPTGITGHAPERKIQVDWDSGSNLALIQGEDQFKIIES